MSFRIGSIVVNKIPLFYFDSARAVIIFKINTHGVQVVIKNIDTVILIGTLEVFGQAHALCLGNKVKQVFSLSGSVINNMQKRTGI